MHERNLRCRWWQLLKTTLPAKNQSKYVQEFTLEVKCYEVYNYVKVIVVEKLHVLSPNWGHFGENPSLRYFLEIFKSPQLQM